MCNLANVTVRDPLLIREVLVIAKSRQASEWDHTAALRSDIHNIMSKSQKSPIELNPFRASSSPENGRGMSIGEAKKYYEEHFT